MEVQKTRNDVPVMQFHSKSSNFLVDGVNNIETPTTYEFRGVTTHGTIAIF
jgi:hypothetical protein